MLPFFLFYSSMQPHSAQFCQTIIEVDSLVDWNV